MEIVIILIAFIGIYIFYKIIDNYLYKKLIQNYKYRIHVNGIRGKSSTTRLIGAVLQNNNIKTVIKSTGSAARIIEADRKEKKIQRKEANIAEQRKILQHYAMGNYEAAVFECMAINPDYIKYLEEKIMLSNIYVITNIRTDHTDVLGETLEDIAKSMAKTIPSNSILITAEDNDHLFEILRKQAEKVNTKIIRANPNIVPDEILSKLKYIEFKENIAIAIEVAKLLNIAERDALKAILKVKPDPGVLKVDKLEINSKKISFVHAFAANDIESFDKIVNIIYDRNEFKNYQKAILLNNRKDRPERVELFAKYAANLNKKLDYIITTGYYENETTKIIKEINNNIPVLNFGDKSIYSKLSGAKILEKILEQTKSDKLLIIGAVNIHTRQADEIRKFIKKYNKRQKALLKENHINSEIVESSQQPEMALN